MKKISYKMIFLLLFGMIILFLNSIDSNAATAGISASSQNVNVGDNVNINVSITAATWNVKVSGSGISDSIVGVNTDVQNQTTNQSYKLNTSKAGTYTVMITGDITDANGQKQNVSYSTTVTVAEKNANPSEGSQSGEQPKEETPKGETPKQETPKQETQKQETQKQETPKENTPTFKNTNETVYIKQSQSSVNVRQGYTTDTKLLGSLKSGESVTRTGIGDNGWSRVTYNGQTAYIISSALTTEEPVKEEETSSNKALKELIIEGYELTPKFNPETTRYSLTLKEGEEKLNITATPEDEKANVTITGNENFDIENSVVRITVTAEDGTTRIYSISVSKGSETRVVEMVRLSNLQVANSTLNPEFNPDVTSYVIETDDPSTITAQDIVATAEDENVEVTIADENSVSENGEKKITIMLEDKENNINTAYEIFIKKPTNNQLDNMVKGNSDNKIYFILGTIIVVLIILIIIIIVVLRKTSDKEDEEDDDEYDEEDDELSDDYSLNNATDEDNEYDDMIRESMIKTQIINTDYNVFKDKSNDIGVDNLDNNIDDEDDDQEFKKKGKHF